MKWLGIDVGGANLKLAAVSTKENNAQAHYAESFPFALWKSPKELSGAIRQAIDQAPQSSGLAATMTGELADCYETKQEGVRHITAALALAAGDRKLAIYGVDGAFHDSKAIENGPLLAAASNWHALARYSGHFLPKHSFLPTQTGLVIDIGSTTTDILPVVSGCVATNSQTDTERLLAGELVYTGAGRTPLCALADWLPYRGSKCPTAAEWFATTADVYFLLGDYKASDTSDQSTADGRAMNPTYAVDRLARQICADRSTFSHDDALTVCRHVREGQLAILDTAIERVLSKLQKQIGHDQCDVVISGSGDFLARALSERQSNIGEIISLAEQTSPRVSQCAAAAAVAWLAEKELTL